MTLVNQPDTLLSELRELKRRLRLLETGRRTPPAHAALVPPPGGPAAFAPKRPSDWWASTSEEWETVAEARAGDGPAEVHVRIATEGPGTTGEARLLQNGTPLAPIATSAGEAVTVIVAVTASAVLTLQARRSAGRGVVRTMAG